MYDTTTWSNYITVRHGRPHHPLVETALSHGTGRAVALDMGAGSLNDSQYLLAQGFTKVIAIDGDDAARKIAETITDPRFTFIQTTFEAYTFAHGPYDLVSAQFSLPFLGRRALYTVMQTVRDTLANGGVFCGQFFGVHDSWNTYDTTMTFLVDEEVRALFTDLGMELLEMTEVEKDEATALGTQKHWHVFHCIARNKK